MRTRSWRTSTSSRSATRDSVRGARARPVTALMKIEQWRGWDVDHIWGSPGKVMGGHGPTKEQAKAFRRDGAVFLPGFLAAELVERLAAGVERDLAQPGPLAITMEPADGSGGSSRTSAAGARSRSTATWSSRAAWARAAELMGTGEVRLFHDHMLVKEAGSSIRTPWHQDQPFYCIDGSRSSRCGSRSIRSRGRPRWSSWPPHGGLVHAAHVPRRERARVRRGHARGGARRRGRSRRVPDPRLGDAARATRSRSTCSRCTRPAGRPRRRRCSFRLIGDDVRYGPRPTARRRLPGPRGRAGGRRADARRPAVPAPVPVASRRAEQGARSPSPARGPSRDCCAMSFLLPGTESDIRQHGRADPWLSGARSGRFSRISMPSPARSGPADARGGESGARHRIRHGVRRRCRV